jgi:hypothetical protein
VPVSARAAHAILGSIGGALEVARRAARIYGVQLGARLAESARSAFALGSQTALVVGASVTVAGALVALVALPARPPKAGRDRPREVGETDS